MHTEFLSSVNVWMWVFGRMNSIMNCSTWYCLELFKRGNLNGILLNCVSLSSAAAAKMPGLDSLMVNL